LKRPFFSYLALAIEMIVAAWVPFLWERSTLPQRCAIIYLIEMALSGLAESLMSLRGIHNIWVINLSTLIEFIIIVIMFYFWERNIFKKRTILILGFLFVIFWVMAKSIFESFDQMDVYTSIVAQTIYILLAVSLLYNVLKDSQTALKNDARVWIASGLLIYSAGTLFVVSLFNVIVTSFPDLFEILWHINWVLVIFITLIIARGIWCQVPKEDLLNQDPG
jgi:hypothetical protein